MHSLLPCLRALALVYHINVVSDTDVAAGLKGWWSLTTFLAYDEDTEHPIFIPLVSLLPYPLNASLASQISLVKVAVLTGISGWQYSLYTWTRNYMTTSIAHRRCHASYTRPAVCDTSKEDDPGRHSNKHLVSKPLNAPCIVSATRGTRQQWLSLSDLETRRTDSFSSASLPRLSSTLTNWSVSRSTESTKGHPMHYTWYLDLIRIRVSRIVLIVDKGIYISETTARSPGYLSSR